MLELLLTALWVGLSSAGATVVIRQAPFIHGWTQKGIKPWACDICMTFWMTLIATSVLEFRGHAALLAWLASYSIGKFALRKLTDPEGVPPGLIPSDMEDDA